MLHAMLPEEAWLHIFSFLTQTEWFSLLGCNRALNQRVFGYFLNPLYAEDTNVTRALNRVREYRSTCFLYPNETDQRIFLKKASVCAPLEKPMLSLVEESMPKWAMAKRENDARDEVWQDVLGEWKEKQNNPLQLSLFFKNGVTAWPLVTCQGAHRVEVIALISAAFSTPRSCYHTPLVAWLTQHPLVDWSQEEYTSLQKSILIFLSKEHEMKKWYEVRDLRAQLMQFFRASPHEEVRKGLQSWFSEELHTEKHRAHSTKERELRISFSLLSELEVYAQDCAFARAHVHFWLSGWKASMTVFVTESDRQHAATMAMNCFKRHWNAFSKEKQADILSQLKDIAKSSWAGEVSKIRSFLVELCEMDKPFFKTARLGSNSVFYPDAKTDALAMDEGLSVLQTYGAPS